MAFVVAVLSCFGLSQLKFCQSSSGQRVCKVRLTGIQITQEELNGIVHVVEHTFAKGQRRPFRRASTVIPIPKRDPAVDLNDRERESGASGSVVEVALGGLPPLPGPMARGDS